MDNPKGTRFGGRDIGYHALVRISLRPTQNVFYDHFNQAANNLVTGAELLATITSDGANYQEISAKLVDIEHDSDEITHTMIRTLNASFITPFDREDIYRLGSTLDDVMDHIEAAGTLVHLYGIEAPFPPEVDELLRVIAASARTAAEAMPKLKSRKGLEEYWIAANTLEDDGDRVYRKLIARLFSDGYDTLTVMKLKELADELEAAVDAFEHVSNVVETIVLKES